MPQLKFKFPSGTVYSDTINLEFSLLREFQIGSLFVPEIDSPVATAWSDSDRSQEELIAIARHIRKETSKSVQILDGDDNLLLDASELK